MGRKVKKLDITEAERIKLERGYKEEKGTFSRRCHIILLKSRGKSSQAIAHIFGITDQSVNSWVKRYRKEGIDGLRTKPGRGRPSTFRPTDEKVVKEIVKKERQRLTRAKELLESQLNKEFSVQTLKRFLKNLSADGNESV